MKDLLRISDLTGDDLSLLLELAAGFEDKPGSAGALMAHARDDAVFMHRLPAHRGQEVTPKVIDGGRSLAFRRAANRLPATQAVLYALLTDRLEGHR